MRGVKAAKLQHLLRGATTRFRYVRERELRVWGHVGVMFRATAVDSSVMLLPYFTASGALGSPDLLLPYPTTKLALHNTIIKIMTLESLSFDHALNQ